MIIQAQTNQPQQHALENNHLSSAQFLIESGAQITQITHIILPSKPETITFIYQQIKERAQNTAYALTNITPIPTDLCNIICEYEKPTKNEMTNKKK